MHTSSIIKPSLLLENSVLLQQLGGHVMGRRYLIGVSGGADSMLLLYLMKESGLPITVAHVNYGLRGKDSLEDEALVVNVCRNYGIDVYVLNAAEQFSGTKKGIQEKARMIRYEWFDSLCKKHQLTHVLTAHTADDAIESFFMFAARGAGASGLSNMRQNQSGVIRPLLNCVKSDILEFVTEKKIPFRHDKSNEENKYLRNYYRNRVIPVIEEKSPRFREGMMHTLHALDNAAAVEEAWMKHVRENYIGFHLAGEVFRLDDFFQKYSDERLVSGFLHQLGLNHMQSKEVIRAFLTNKSGKLWTTEKNSILLHAGKLIIENEQHAFVSVTWENPSEVFMMQYLTCLVSKHKNANDVSGKEWQIPVSKNKLRFPLQLRNKKPGDYFYPEKGSGKVLVSDYLTNLGMDRFSKERVLLLCKDHDVISIPFYRNDKRFLASEEEEEIQYIQLRKTT